MIVEFDFTTIKTIVEVIALCAVVYGYFSKLIHFMDRQKEQDREISEIKEEQQLLTYGILSCLKGLQEQGCNGPVSEAVSKIEKHINEKAHK